MARTMIVEWEAPVNYPDAALDVVLPGGLFSQGIPDDRVDHYEVERFDPGEKIFMTIGYPRSPRIEFAAEDFENATVRIRAVFNSGSKTPFMTTATLVFSMVAEFSSPNNTILLSFI